MPLLNMKPQMVPKAKNMYSGMSAMPLLRPSSLGYWSTRILTDMKKIAARVPDRTGEMNQEAATPAKPPIGGLDQTTPPQPNAVMPTPSVAPTTEWVVETGMARKVAPSTHRPEPTLTIDMPVASTYGSCVKYLTSTIFLRMVSVTSLPSATTPTNSKMHAIRHACLCVTVPAPTALAKALATSLAPMVKATRMESQRAGKRILTFMMQALRASH